jgi:hypothetical protein
MNLFRLASRVALLVLLLASIAHAGEESLRDAPIEELFAEGMAGMDAFLDEFVVGIAFAGPELRVVMGHVVSESFGVITVPALGLEAVGLDESEVELSEANADDFLRSDLFLVRAANGMPVLHWEPPIEVAPPSGEWTPPGTGTIDGADGCINPCSAFRFASALGIAVPAAIGFMGGAAASAGAGMAAILAALKVGILSGLGTGSVFALGGVFASGTAVLAGVGFLIVASAVASAVMAVAYYIQNGTYPGGDLWGGDPAPCPGCGDGSVAGFESWSYDSAMDRCINAWSGSEGWNWAMGCDPECTQVNPSEDDDCVDKDEARDPTMEAGSVDPAPPDSSSAGMDGGWTGDCQDDGECQANNTCWDGSCEVVGTSTRCLWACVSYGDGECTGGPFDPQSSVTCGGESKAEGPN